MCGHDQLLQPPQPARNGRRRSADIGGLSLATGGGGHGQGWLGHSGDELQTRFAELLSDMYTQTLAAVNEHTAACASPDLPPETRVELIKALEGWNFEPSTLPSEDHVAACAVLIFEALFRIEGMQQAVGVSLSQIPPFIQHLRHIYRWQNSYHNFEHALDVLQATYSYLRAADMVPPLSILLDTKGFPESSPPGPLITVLAPQDLFVLAIAAIGHDVGHPGFTNLFMANASAPLSAVFDGKSPLEQMHCALLMRVMRAHGMGGWDAHATGAGGEKGEDLRRLLSDIVLATDMRCTRRLWGGFGSCLGAGGDKASKRTTLCQAIIKCADISNPSRPYYISQHWASALLREWNAQAALERHHHLPPTVEASDHPLRAAHSQMFFIPAFVKPLLDVVVRGVPEMHPYQAQCDLNLALWTARLAVLQAAADASSPTPKPDIHHRAPSPYPPDDYRGAFPLALPPSHWHGGTGGRRRRRPRRARHRARPRASPCARRYRRARARSRVRPPRWRRRRARRLRQ
ncbi:hypothetical protein B0H13DRAFT_1607358 [Mycena leptocephala]|nr:hypothetical protein B0H13DRAFT_1607358 [Mycena leptocephala]